MDEVVYGTVLMNDDSFHDFLSKEFSKAMAFIERQNSMNLSRHALANMLDL